MKPGEISVVIPAFNEARNIQRCVQSALAAGEVIVVDGGSDDETCQIAEAAGAKVLQCDAGRARQQNAGAQIAIGNTLLFLHADNQLAPSAIKQVADALYNNPDRWGGAMKQRIDAAGIGYRMLERGNALRVRWRGLPFGDQAIFVRRDVFTDVGCFDDVPIMEDLILSKRLRRIAWPLLIRGPVSIDARRWKSAGIVRQTLRNFAMQTALASGISPTRLRSFYPNHSE